MHRLLRIVLATLGVFFALALLHAPLLKLPYFWDEAGYYIPAALDFYHHALLIPRSTLPNGHTPLVVMYLGLAWRLFGFSPLVTRLAMILVAAATVVALWKLARRVAPACQEPAIWSAALLAISPLFFAQSSLAHLDLAAALFTTLAVAALLGRRLLTFAIAASLAVLAKETAVILLPAAWLLAGWRWREKRVSTWLALGAPLVPLGVWAACYHHRTGFWIGNAGYLQYNLYSTLNPWRILFSLGRRLYEVFISGFDWLLAAGAIAGLWRSRKAALRTPNSELRTRALGFFFLATALTAAYLALLSAVGGAVLPRYLLPIFPVLYLAGVMLVLRLPRMLARSLLALILACFVAAWFINPPYPFPFEDNLSYADFIRLHQEAARFLEQRADQTRILTAWPASDELRQPYLGYVTRSLNVVPLGGFTSADFAAVNPNSFDVLLLYSRKWEPPGNWLTRFRILRKMQRLYFDYAPQPNAEAIAQRYDLKLIARFRRRGQWAAIYARRP